MRNVKPAGVQSVRTSYPAALPMQYAMLADALRSLGHADRVNGALAEGQSWATRLGDRHEPMYDLPPEPELQSARGLSHGPRCRNPTPGRR